MMGDIHIRNAWGRNSGIYSASIGTMFGFLLREAFLAGKWQIIEEGADTGWTNNILLSLSDAAVTVAEPLKVTSATGGFTSSHEGYLVTMVSSNDDICGMYNVRTVIDSNTIILHSQTRKNTWPADVGSITLRLHDLANTQRLGDTYFVAQAPAASGTNLQLYVTVDNSTNTMKYKAYPLGDYLGAGTATTEASLNMNYDYSTRLNAYFADPAADPFYCTMSFYDSNRGLFNVLTVGLISDVVAGDTDPGFLNFNEGFDYLSYGGTAMRGLNESNVQINYYPTYYKRWSSDVDDDKRESLTNTRRINGGKHKLFRPIVVAEGTANGGFIRGIDPRTFCHQDITTYEELGADWWKMESHAVIPRDGANDLRPTTNMTY